MQPLSRAGWRRMLRELGAKPGDPTFGGLLPSDERFTPAAGVLDLYAARTDVKQQDLEIVILPKGEDNLERVSVSHTAAGVSARASGATSEIAFHQAMPLLRARLVVIRAERERRTAAEAGAKPPSRGVRRVGS